MEPLIVNSARRHGVADEDILHAYRNHTRTRMGRHDLLLLIGPDHAGRELEVGVVQTTEGYDVIVHAMRARPDFLR